MVKDTHTQHRNNPYTAIPALTSPAPDLDDIFTRNVLDITQAAEDGPGPVKEVEWACKLTSDALTQHLTSATVPASSTKIRS
jgi:hypothetical protein